MKTYKVRVIRTAFKEVTLEVQAECAADATLMAGDSAFNLDFSDIAEEESTYETELVDFY